MQLYGLFVFYKSLKAEGYQVGDLIKFAGYSIIKYFI